MPFPKTSSRRPAAGFTLVELMISLALVLLLTVAMARIFGVTTRAISKGTAVGEVVRGLDATRTALQLDFTGAEAGVGYDPLRDARGILPLAEQPAIIISSKTYNTFLDAADGKADSDGDPKTIDRDGDGVDEATPPLTNFQTGRRWFRGDRLSFFARGDYKSQAQGNANAFVSDVSAPDAWVWYGHGRVYSGGANGDINQSSQYISPGAGNAAGNPNNYYASDWILLRDATLLKGPVDHDGTPNQDTVTDASNQPVLHMDLRQFNNAWSAEDPRNIDTVYQTKPATQPPPTNFGSPANVAPLGYGNRAFLFPAAQSGQATGTNQEFVYKTNFPYLIQHGRVDVAGVTARAFRQHLDAIQQVPILNGIWYQAPTRNWYSQLFASEATTEQRFWVNADLVRPIDAGELSQATSLLLPGCTQFVVEYAGDFLTQNPNDGSIIATAPNNGLAPDGRIDFTVDVSGVRHTRWYGLPRDVDGDGSILGPGATAADLLDSIDVRPLADYRPDPNLPFPFERRLPGKLSGSGANVTPNARGGIADYANIAANFLPYNNGASYAAGSYDGTYVVAWGPGDFDGTAYQAGGPYAAFAGYKFGPSLIRVVVTGIDGQRKLEEPITQELVFRVPAE